MEKKKSGSSLYFLAGILFIASAAVGGNYAFYAIGPVSYTHLAIAVRVNENDEVKK